MPILGDEKISSLNDDINMIIERSERGTDI